MSSSCEFETSPYLLDSTPNEHDTASGPTGSGKEIIMLCLSPSDNKARSGKTLLVKTLARVLDVPFSQSDATSFTQVSGRGSLLRIIN